MLGIYGLGRMGFNMAQRLLDKKEKIVVFNRSRENVDELAKKGAIPSYSHEEFIKKLGEDKIVWLMIPHQAVDQVIKDLKPLLNKDDIIVDGGNSNFNSTIKRAKQLEKEGVSLVDVGVSGGIIAAKEGYCMMAGGDEKAYKKVLPYIKKMCQKDGYGYFGKSGSGHFVKMVHNAIEYGMMESIGEGIELLDKGPYKNLDLHQISKVWNNGSIIRSFLMEMTESGLKKHNELEVSGEVADSGEGRWAVETAMEYKVPFTVNTQALFSRYRSRMKDSTSNKIVAIMRDGFGGHGLGKK